MARLAIWLKGSVLLLPLAAQAPAMAQAFEQEAAARPPIFETPNVFRPGWRDRRFMVPDIAPDLLLLPRLNTPWFTLRPGMELILDHDSFRQDADSLAQVGRQANQFEVRSAGVDLTGELGVNRNLDYKIGIAYNGFNVDADENWAITDFNIAFSLARWQTRVRVGQMREDVGYEVVGSTSTMPQSERILTPFTSAVNFGLKVTHVLGSNQRATLTYGLFKNDSGRGDGQVALSARATVLAVDQPGRFLHLGAAVRRADVDSVARFTGRPGISSADDFVDTGDFEARSTTTLGLEAHYADGPWSVIAELATSRADVPIGRDPVFRGFYVLGSWVPTGEQRPYDRRTGQIRRLVPTGRWGAPELVMRYASVDLSSEGIDGGRYDRIEMGANWWATTRWKFGLLYGHVWLDRFGLKGTTDTLLTRLQWVY